MNQNKSLQIVAILIFEFLESRTAGAPESGWRVDGEVDAKLEHSNVNVTNIHRSLDLEHDHGRVVLKGNHGDLSVISKELGSLVVAGVGGGRGRYRTR